MLAKFKDDLDVQYQLKIIEKLSKRHKILSQICPEIKCKKHNNK